MKTAFSWPVLPPEYREWVRSAQQLLSRADGILRILFHARGGSPWEKLLVGASLLSEAIEVLTPYRSAGDALRDAGYEPLSTGIGAFLYSLLHDTQTPSEATVYEQGEESLTEILYYSPPSLPRAVAVVRVDGEFSEGPFVLSGGSTTVHELIRAYAWKTFDREVTAGRAAENASHRYTRGASHRVYRRKDPSAPTEFQVVNMPPVARYVGNPALEWYATRMSAYRTTSVSYHRTIRLVGPSGVGKTTLARVLGKAMFGAEAKTLRIASQATGSLSQGDLLDLVELVGPDVFIIDDYKSIDDEVGQGDLSFLEALHERVPLTVLTTMDEDPMGGRERRDLGMRPGRVDETFVLEEPKTDVRKLLLQTFLSEAEMALSPKDLDALIQRTEGMTGAYVEELVRRIAVHGIGSWAAEVSKLKGEIDVYTDRRKRVSRRRRVAHGRSGRAVRKGVLNPLATARDLKQWCIKNKVKPEGATKEALIAAVTKALAEKREKKEKKGAVNQAGGAS